MPSTAQILPEESLDTKLYIQISSTPWKPYCNLVPAPLFSAISEHRQPCRYLKLFCLEHYNKTVAPVDFLLCVWLESMLIIVWLVFFWNTELTPIWCRWQRVLHWFVCEETQRFDRGNHEHTKSHWDHEPAKGTISLAEHVDRTHINCCQKNVDECRSVLFRYDGRKKWLFFTN